MKYIVIGGTGFIGKSIAKKIVALKRGPEFETRTTFFVVLGFPGPYMVLEQNL